MEYTLRQQTPPGRLSSLIRQFVGADTVNLDAPQAILKALSFSKDRSHGRAIGDYYQFGVLSDNNMRVAYNYCQTLGLDEVQLLEFGYNSRDTGGVSGIPNERSKIINGFFGDAHPNTFRSSYVFRNAAVVVLQGISYKPTLAALNWVRPYLTQNTVLLFDNLNATDGSQFVVSQQRALQEFLADHPQFSLKTLNEFNKRGCSLVIRIDNRAKIGHRAEKTPVVSQA